jgi:chromosome segregation ATPase
MSGLSADQLVEASARARLEVKALAAKLEEARKAENVSTREANLLRGQVVELRDRVAELEADKMVSGDRHAAEISKFKTEVQELSGAREAAASAAKKLGQQTGKADEAVERLKEYEAEHKGLLAEIQRLTDELRSSNQRLSDVKDAVLSI